MSQNEEIRYVAYNPRTREVGTGYNAIPIEPTYTGDLLQHRWVVRTCAVSDLKRGDFYRSEQKCDDQVHFYNKTAAYYGEDQFEVRPITFVRVNQHACKLKVLPSEWV